MREWSTNSVTIKHKQIYLLATQDLCVAIKVPLEKWKMDGLKEGVDILILKQLDILVKKCAPKYGELSFFSSTTDVRWLINLQNIFSVHIVENTVLKYNINY